MRFDLAITGGTAYLPGGLTQADLGFRDGRIVAIGRIDPDSADETMDAAGLTLLPGVIDSQVHFREPGFEHKEDLGTGTASAALGGVTAICEMPNTKPSTTTAEALADKLARAKGRAWVDHAFFVGAAAESIGKLAELEKLPGCAGIKMFMGSSTGTLLVADEADQARVMADGVRRVAIHAEDEYRLRERWELTGSGDPSRHPIWRDVTTALMATERILRLSKAAGRPVQILHITSAEEMEVLAQHKDLATVEVTPQHLTLSAPECYERLGTYAQMNPPVRDEHHRQALWRAVNDGVADVIGSDHAPHTREEKDHPYPQSHSGMTGVQTLVPVMLDHVAAGRLSLTRFVDMTSAGPARAYRMAGKGRLAVGYDADVTIVDLAMTRKITNQWIASRSGWTPFDGMKVTGWPMATIVGGRIVMQDGQLLGDPSGKPIRFIDTIRSPASAE